MNLLKWWQTRKYGNKERIVLIVGASASGKTRLVDSLVEFGYKPIDSYTTRPKRKPTEGGHRYVNQREFDAIRHDLVAYTKYDRFEYGATREQVKTHHLYVIDPKGVKYFQNFFPRENMLIIYICATEEKRELRMQLERGRDAASDRIVTDRREFSLYDNYDLQLINNTEEQFACNRMLLKRLVRDWYRHSS